MNDKGNKGRGTINHCALHSGPGSRRNFIGQGYVAGLCSIVAPSFLSLLTERGYSAKCAVEAEVKKAVPLISPGSAGGPKIGGNSMEHWQENLTLLSALTVRVFDVGSGGEGLIGGHFEGKQDDLTHRRLSRQACVMSLRKGTCSQTFHDSGSISLLDQCGSVAYGILVRAKTTGRGSDYWLIRSTDGGASWDKPRQIESSSVQQFVAVTESEVWLLGAPDILACSRDAGRSWQRVCLPGRRNAIQERIVRLNDGQVALLGRGMQASAGGGAWSTLVDPTYRVYAAEGEYVAVSDQTRQFLARRSSTGLEKLIDIPRDRLPLQLAAAGSVIRLVTREVDPQDDVGIEIRRSEDSGRTWTTSELPVQPIIDISGSDGGMALTLLNAILVSA